MTPAEIEEAIADAALEQEAALAELRADEELALQRGHNSSI